MPSYTVGWGDSYLSIAKKLYGNERYAQQLVDLNGVQILKPGMSLSLPNSVPDSPMITTATLNALLAKVPEAMGTAAPAPVVSGGNIVQPAVQPGGSTSGAFNNNLPPTIPPASPITSSGKETSPILPSAGSGIAPLWKPKEFITPPTITSKELAPSKEGAPISKEAIMKDAPRPLNLTKDAADIVNSKEAAGISKEEMDWLKEEAKNTTGLRESFGAMGDTRPGGDTMLGPELDRPTADNLVAKYQKFQRIKTAFDVLQEFATSIMNGENSHPRLRIIPEDEARAALLRMGISPREIERYMYELGYMLTPHGYIWSGRVAGLPSQSSRGANGGLVVPPPDSGGVGYEPDGYYGSGYDASSATGRQDLWGTVNGSLSWRVATG